MGLSDFLCAGARRDSRVDSTLGELLLTLRTGGLLAELGCTGVISQKGFPLQAGARWVVERTNPWHNRGFGKLRVCTERHTRVIDAYIALANTIIIVRRLIRTAWTTHRWDTKPTRKP